MKREQLRQIVEHEVTIRFPQVDPAGIVFYPRHFEMAFRYFPDIPIGRTPFAIKTEFLKPNRLGDRLRLVFENDSRTNHWSLTGRKDGDDCFTMRPLDGDDDTLRADAHREARGAFRTAVDDVGDWATDRHGRLCLSRYFEYLNMAIEEWFEDSLDLPYHELQFDRKIGIPTVRFVTRCRELPKVGESISLWLRPTNLGRRAMTFKSWFLRDDECLVENEQVIVFVQMTDDGYEAIPIPDDIRDKFATQVSATEARQMA